MLADDHATLPPPKQTLLTGFLALAFAAIALSQTPPGREDGRNNMTASLPASPSIILRATHILLARVDSSAATPWQTPPNQWRERQVDLTLHIEEILKGAVQRRTDVAIRITQYANPGLVNQPIPGVWSAAPVDRGGNLLIFASVEASTAADPARLFTEPACLGIVPARTALTGVRLAMRRESGQLSMPGFLAEAVGAAGDLDLIFTDYLKALLDRPEMASKVAFDHLMALVESPRLAIQPRMALLREIQYALSVAPVYTAAHRERFVIALFRVALASTEPGIRQQILGATLPNVIGLSDGGATLAASQVFHDTPQERARILEDLKPFLSQEPIARLAAWLKR